MNKKKIINDPVYGFITINNELIFEIIEHPYFQRLRRIKQLGLTDFVYPGALHTRFHHTIGATYLMGLALDNLRAKDVEISHEEYEAAQACILLHDIGHGPFSHALEYSLLEGVKHESLSYQIMKKLNEQFSGKLSLAMQIFRNSYERKFFHQLVSSQLDVDRLDYLKRDSFFTGVSEGTIGVDRILKMMDVHNDEIVVEEKAIYSLENFLNARRLMYWQVYLHKTSLSAERMLINLMIRAKYLAQSGVSIPCSQALAVFLRKTFSLEDFHKNIHVLDTFARLDDYDIWGAIKNWSTHEDNILADLSNRLLERRLFKIILSNEPIKKQDIEQIKKSIKNKYGLLSSETPFYFSHGEVTNAAYVMEGQSIKILTKKGEIKDILEAADLPNIKAMSKIVKKYYICRPKNLYL